MLKARFPNATVHLVANPASAMVLEGSPSIDRVIPYRAPWHALWRGGSVDWRAETAQLWRLSAQLRAERYDVAFELRGDYRDIVFAATAAPKLLVGSGMRGGARLLDGDAALPENGHQVELAAAIASYGANVPTVDAPRVHPTERHYAKAREHLGDGGATIALHLGAGFPSKSLPLDKFHAIVRSLMQTDRNRRFVILGGQEERELVDKFIGGLPAEAATIDLCAGLSLLESAAVLAALQALHWQRQRANALSGGDGHARSHIFRTVRTLEVPPLRLRLPARRSRLSRAGLVIMSTACGRRRCSTNA